MSNTPYGMKGIINKIQQENIQPCDYATPTNKQRSKSFLDRVVGGMVERAEAEGDTINFKIEEEEIQPPPPKRSATVLPSLGTRRVKNGIRPSSGVFSLVYDMQELDQDAFMLFYLEASREFEERTGDEGWTGKVMGNILEKKNSPLEVPEEEKDLPNELETALCDA